MGTNGNLILADADGSVVCQTNTANKGVVGFQVLPNGNMVLHDGNDNLTWQSFDSPTDSLLVGQSLRAGGANKLVSRASEVNNLDGAYSLVMEPKGLSMYCKSPNSPLPILYWTSSEWFTINKELVYTFLNRDSIENVCQLPKRCGKFGLYEDSQCVACSTPNGLSGWSKDCDVKKVTSCKASDFQFYKFEGVDHFMIKYTRGDEATKQSDCESKRMKDCKYMGYFYHTDESSCWIGYDLKRLAQVGNSTHVAYS
ncbi:epidermis-specific secreted glycoprotein EP1 [Tanacetum coccineum]